MTPGLRRGLIEIGAAGADIGDWWIIGSAAMALWGFDVEPHDIDVFGPEPAMRRFLDRWALRPASIAPATASARRRTQRFICPAASTSS